MADISHRTGTAGLPPSNIIAANTYNPTIGATVAHPDSYPPGTPVVQSLSVDGTVVPGRANAVGTSSLVGLMAAPAVVGERGFVQFQGVLHLTTAEWDAVTGGSGGLTRGVPYYLSAGFTEGRLTTTPPAGGGDFVSQAGVALGPTDMLVQICCPEAV